MSRNQSEKCSRSFPAQRRILFQNFTTVFFSRNFPPDRRVGKSIDKIQAYRNLPLLDGNKSAPFMRLSACKEIIVGLTAFQILPPQFHFFLPDCLHGPLPGPFLLSYSVFIFIFSLFFRFWSVHQIKLATPPAFERTLIYHIVSYRSVEARFYRQIISVTYDTIRHDTARYAKTHNVCIKVVTVSHLNLWKEPLSGNDERN